MAKTFILIYHLSVQFLEKFTINQSTFKKVMVTTPILRPHFFTSARLIKTPLSCKNIQSSKSTTIVLSLTLRFNLYLQFNALPLATPFAFPTTSDASPEYLSSPRIFIVHILVSFSPSS